MDAWENDRRAALVAKLARWRALSHAHALAGQTAVADAYATCVTEMRTHFDVSLEELWRAENDGG